MAEEKIEYTVYRRGTCAKCGYCCPKSCEHFDAEKGLCKIQENKPEGCSRAPEFPMRQANSKCGYGFYIEGRPDLEVIEMLCSKIPEGKKIGLSGVAYIQAGAFFRKRVPKLQEKLNELIGKDKEK